MLQFTFSAPDLRPALRRRRRRRHRRVGDPTGDGSTDESDCSSCSQDSEDEPNLDGVYGNAGARPGDLSERRSWQDNDDHDWGRNNWVGQACVPEGVRTRVKGMMCTGRDALASEPSSTGPPINTKQVPRSQYSAPARLATSSVPRPQGSDGRDASWSSC